MTFQIKVRFSKPNLKYIFWLQSWTHNITDLLFKTVSLYDSFWAFQNFCSRQKCRIVYRFFMDFFMLRFFWVQMTCQTKVRFPELFPSFLKTSIIPLLIEKLKTHVIIFKAISLYERFWSFQMFCFQTKCQNFLSIWEACFCQEIFELGWLVK